MGNANRHVKNTYNVITVDWVLRLTYEILIIKSHKNGKKHQLTSD